MRSDDIALDYERMVSGVKAFYEAREKPLAQHHDSGKTRVELIDPYCLEKMGEVLAFGASKYDAWNWTKGISYGRLLGSILRHLYAFMRREDLDPESGLPHLAHTMCDVMFLLSMTKRHPNLDDRMPDESLQAH